MRALFVSHSAIGNAALVGQSCKVLTQKVDDRQGRAEVALDNVASRITTLDRLGSYRLDVIGDAQGQLQLNLGTLDGALNLSGSGGITPTGVRFRGEARASEASQGALDNLLNIIGRRQGDRSVISIG